VSSKRALTDRESALPALAEAFREHGFEGATLTSLSKATGLGKGSLYNFFPGGKEEMMQAVLENIDGWFANTIFSPLEQAVDPAAAITTMFDDVTTYFRSGRRVCVVGSLGLNSSGIQGAIVLARALGDEASFQRIVGRLQSTLLDAIGRYV
jgi:AcrR family transcriptional regulator